MLQILGQRDASSTPITDQLSAQLRTWKQVAWPSAAVIIHWFLLGRADLFQKLWLQNVYERRSQVMYRDDPNPVC